MPFLLLFVNPCSNKRPLTVNFKQYLYQCLRSATRCRCLLCIHFSIIGFHDLIHDPARTSDRNSQALRQLMCIENITFSYICNGNDLQISASFIVPPVPIPTFRLILFSSSWCKNCTLNPFCIFDDFFFNICFCKHTCGYRWHTSVYKWDTKCRYKTCNDT